MTHPSNGTTSGPAPAPAQARPKGTPADPIRLPPLAPGEIIPQHVAPRAGSRDGVTLAEVWSIAVWWKHHHGALRRVEASCKASRRAVARLVREGYPARGVPPLSKVPLEHLPNPPVAWGVDLPPPGEVPVVREASTPMPEREPDEVPKEAMLLEVPGASPKPVPVLPAGAPSQAAQDAPQGAGGDSSAARASEMTAAPTGPLTLPGLAPSHTLSVANAELARASRGLRALFMTRNKAMSKLFDVMRGAVTGGTRRLSKSERDLLVLIREAGRVHANDVATLYRLEVAILGVGHGAGVPADATVSPGEVDADERLQLRGESIDALKAQLRRLLDENPNTPVPDDDPGGTPVVMMAVAMPPAQQESEPVNGG